MMKRIGIITYYDAINEGAFLQAYCLKKFLEENFKAQVFFVKNSKINNLNLQKKVLFSVRNPKSFFLNSVRYYSLRKAQKSFLPIEDKEEQVDLAIVGSDEMWNVKNALFSSYNINGNISAKRMVSYAVSMGDFSDKMPQEITKKIEEFDLLSVRDYNAKSVLERSGINSMSIHLDPVFLIDIPHKKPNGIRKPFLMVYGNISNPKCIESIKKFARKKGLLTVSVDMHNKWCDLAVVAKSPFEFVGYVDMAKFVVTNMFHGTMLAVVRNRPFISIQTARRSKKIEYAAKKLGFIDRCIDEEGLLDIEEVDKSSIDFNSINSIILEERNNVREYFKKALQ